MLSEAIAKNVVQAGFIKHTVNKSTFSEQCYYTFGDIAAALANSSLKVNLAVLSTMLKVMIPGL